MKNSTKKIKVGLVIDDSLDRNDGVQQYVRTLGTWLGMQGHTVHYLTGHSSSKDKVLHSLTRNVGVRFNGNRLTIPLPAKSRVIKTLLNKEKYDVLHVQMPFSPMLAGKIIKLASTHTAIVGTFHILPLGRWQKYGNKALAVVQKRQLQRFDAICSVSSAAQQFAKSYYGIASRVITNTIDFEHWHSVIRSHPGRIVYLGRLVPRKGCLELLKALGAMPSAVRDKTEVLIAGDGPLRKKLEKFARENELNKVSFLGYVDEKHKADLLASAELAVFPSTGGESFGIVLIEAMAAGANVVLGGNNPGYQTVLRNWPDVMFDPRDSTAFSESLKRFLGDRKLRSSINSHQQAAVKQYDVNLVGKQIVDLYEEALLHRQREMR